MNLKYKELFIPTVAFPALMALLIFIPPYMQSRLLCPLSYFLLTTPLRPINYLFELIFGTSNILMIRTGFFANAFPNVLGILVLFIIYAVVGLLIGWIIKKIKLAR